MASTPSNRLKLTPSNSPFLTRPSRSSIRPRAPYEPCLSLRRVIGTTCNSPTGFDTVQSSFAYIAGGTVVVVDVSGEHYSQRFYRARPSAVPVYVVSPVSNSSSTPNATPKANDSRNRSAASPRDYGTSDWSDSPSSKTWTSRERIKAATCLALSRDGRYLAVGETGYAPRVLIFNLQEPSSDIPLVAISEHTFGVKAVAWSPDTKFLASLGAANDGFVFLWKIDPRTGAAKLFQQNRCTSHVKGMVWMGSNLITLGVRHVKVWRVEEPSMSSPAKPKFLGDTSAAAASQAQKPLQGRNILLGSLLDATFCCALAIGDDKAIICSETGSVCLLDDTNKQTKLVKVLDLGFNVTCISMRNDNVYIGGKDDGDFALVSLESILSGNPDPTIRSSHTSDGFVAMGFLADNLVTIDTKQSIDVWSPDFMPETAVDENRHIPIPGAGDPIVGIQRLSPLNQHGAAFFTWCGSGKIIIWDMEGVVKSVFHIPIEQISMNNDPDQPNQVVVVRATTDGNLFVAGDKLGVLRIVDASSRVCLLETKAHSSDCQDITVHEGKTRTLVASCGRDRTVQLFQRTSAGIFEHFQTLEFTAKVVKVLIPTEDKILTCSLDRTIQIHDLVNKEGEPEVMAALPSKVISLKASPSSMAVTLDEKGIYVALLDRSVCHYDFSTGRLLGSFKCNDEAGLESVVLESLTYGYLPSGDLSYILGISNTDKSIRLYDAQSGLFVDREWGHTEAINGVALIDGAESGQKVVSVGEDGTIMIWTLDLSDSAAGSRSRDPSPDKTPSASARPPLRRVLSKAELAEFQRPTSSPGRRSPPRASHGRPSKIYLSAAARTPNVDKQQLSPASIVIEDSPSRRASSGGSRSDSPPPESPKSRSRMFRRPSLPALSMTPTNSIKSRKKSNSNMRGSNGLGSLSMATEQACRALRTYRKKLTSSESINSDVLSELDAELRLTAAALGERAIRSRSTREPSPKPVSESMLSGLLDQYSERLVTMLDEKLKLRLSEEEKDSFLRDRPRTGGEGSSQSGASTIGTGFTDSALCDEPVDV
ncbi:WD40-repeat-containing domain protein [Cladorrhinum sp. PSN259]|nr:WD40-repeat-containing domain protein [Cladorrhinum sp. PSN259]